jgi:hypothetical protein
VAPCISVGNTHTLCALLPQPAVLAVDDSRYGLGTALPASIVAALDPPEAAPPLPKKRQQRRQAARQQWRAAVADAAVGAPTPVMVHARPEPSTSPQTLQH